VLVSGPLHVKGLKSQRPTCSRVVWRSKAALAPPPGGTAQHVAA
jgi:hypothetical protein